jgi:adenosylcobinamide kinase / adenosylcobinamide-phosphate guanylyltransferase
MSRGAKSLLIGGARSGKSSIAERWASERADRVICIVTATESDAEMTTRIAAHRARRPESWQVIEAPIKLGAALREAQSRYESRNDSSSSLIVIDCLTVWTANCLWPPSSDDSEAADEELAADYAGWRREREALLEVLRSCTGSVIVVSNEVGTGIIPANAAARLFIDEQGWLNQSVAALCDEVFMVTAGIPVRIKPER